MEKRLTRIEIGMIILLILNIILIILFTQNQEIQDNEIVTEDKDLPQEFNEKVQERVLFDIKETYNCGDFVKFHKIFSEWAQIQISEETIETEFSKLIKVTGNIIHNVYSNQEYIGYDGGADWYFVYYKTKFENGIGTTKLKLRVIGANWEIVGINITLDEI